MQEQWIRWEPIKGLSEKYNIESISYKPDCFEIILSLVDGEKRVKLIFENSIEAYRYSDEFLVANIMHMLSEEYGQKFWTETTLFKVLNSTYIKWFSEQSFKIANILPLIHFSIITPYSILDIVTTYEPKVELIEYK